MNRGDCAHPTRCGSDGVRCSWLDCQWSVEGGRTWPPPRAIKPVIRDAYSGSLDDRLNPWVLAVVLVLAVACAIVIYAAVRTAG